jgi:tetratricopeptide (TPR) repeat protein
MFDVRRLFAALRRPSPGGDPFALGLAASERGAHETALAAFESAAATATDGCGRARAHNKRGVALVALERRAEALEAFCSALAEDERCAPALVNIGNMLLDAGHPQDALDYYEAAIRAEDGYATAHRNLAVALRRLGRRGDAVRALKRAVRLETARPRERS